MTASYFSDQRREPSTNLIVKPALKQKVTKGTATGNNVLPMDYSH